MSTSRVDNIVCKPNTDPALKKIYPYVTHWVYNGKDEELGCVEKVKLGRKNRLAFKGENNVYLTSKCLRSLADILEHMEKNVAK